MVGRTKGGGERKRERERERERERLLEMDKYINTMKIPIMNTLLIRYAI